MRTYSTPQSALDGEITKLAILECVLSVVLYVGLGVYFGTFKYLAVAVVFAPLMLFRTEFSADWGLRVYERMNQTMEKWPGLLAPTGGFVLTPVAGAALRIVATVYCAIRRPIHTLKEAPRNWLRQSFCTDFAHPPEIMPLEIVKGDGQNILLFSEFLEIFREETVAKKFLFIFVTLPLLTVGWLPSVIYRVSFKATALAYAPFVWVAHATLRNPLPVKARLERFTKGELEKVRRGVSYFVLGTLVAKGALVWNWVDRSYVESKFPSQRIVTEFVVLDAWPWWQITFAADAVLTFALLYFADAALSRIEGGRPWREEPLMTAVTSVSFLRAAFGLLTISHFFYIALLAAAPNSVRPLLAF